MNFGNSVYPALPVSFGRDSKSSRSLLSGVYARGSERPHQFALECVTVVDSTAHSKLSQKCVYAAENAALHWQRRRRKAWEEEEQFNRAWLVLNMWWQFCLNCFSPHGNDAFAVFIVFSVTHNIYSPMWLMWFGYWYLSLFSFAVFRARVVHSFRFYFDRRHAFVSHDVVCCLEWHVWCRICLIIVSGVSFRMPPPVTGPSETELAMKVRHFLLFLIMMTINLHL